MLLISYPPTASFERLVLPQHYGGLSIAKMHNSPCMTIESSLEVLNKNEAPASDGLEVDDINVGRVAVHGAKSGETTSLMVKVCGGS